MSDDILLKVPALRRGYRFQFEPAQGCHVLLYPEGMIKLNESASAVLELVDGARTAGAIVAELQARFPEAEGIEEDILGFLEVALERFWIEFR
ncbi:MULTISPECIES: pyrroloquinoline quinone biosynthesis peptide chaperone PqqD [Stutzerimonas]|jgi:pyrroloquinoline quinone biosynthesis protein D|uniref:PqqA binding protein n=1 Tax=Stutzerimonas balearica TaxID=74829 RepID=A0A9X7V5W4_9GAMM|nr:pyrroloquinoline quinone biosynthesis peptide chaperone PqqD [Stutzerimonas balearica]KIL05659.1 pyrroloquinoline quinone biosynthesis protein PqqD [Stutzerimonas stutzeri]MBB60794.1 pyrroloquinoline quinone biosynthesis peptide chaperone PqqD [Pseudomonas sp.]MBZ5756114.1 pyrroloquinoline quinone biosynthesis peptide chaperone PqqD [Pseudomonas sp. S5(2021)]WIX04564.1 pyrroloquinoline quinone biosynthesis peptide chaperone PqqD [Pseudomonas sp. AR5]MBC7199512.1 pyrroloquinoline quinone bio|tara:strand:+ start:230 stop:508 length:279 start_codon:yes stop_codon:yes gene_type:complete